MRLPTAFLAFASFALHAQQPTSSAPPIAADRQIVGMFDRLSQHALRIQPMLEQVRAADWVSKGAADTYVAQLTSAREQIQAIQTDLAELTQHPDHMQDCLKALFRIQGFHRSLDSLMAGLRRYQNPALADLIVSVAAEDQADLEQLQSYILDLANQREQEYLVVDREAQRCRATISREPARRTNQ